MLYNGVLCVTYFFVTLSLDCLCRLSISCIEKPQFPMLAEASSHKSLEKRKCRRCSNKSVIISETVDPREKNLLLMSKISDYILLNDCQYTMVAEDCQLYILEELFAGEVIFLLPNIYKQQKELLIDLIAMCHILIRVYGEPGSVIIGGPNLYLPIY